MAYETTFYGAFEIAPALSLAHHNYLSRFCEIRHVRRDVNRLARIPDPVREMVGLPLGEEAAFCLVGEDRPDVPDVIQYNAAPGGQPSVYCYWRPSADGCRLEWSGVTAFREPEKWLEYLTGVFLNPWGYMLSGAVRFQGEAADDAGWLVVEESHVRFAPLVAPTSHVSATPYALASGGGVPGFDPSVKAGRISTGGALTLIESRTQGGAPLHVHTREDEFLYVLEGNLMVRCADAKYEVGSGACVFLPRRVPHGWDVVTDEATVLLITVPAMLEEFLQEFHAVSDPIARAEIAARYGITFLQEQEGNA